MKVVSTLILVGFVSLALFGFVGMLASSEMMDNSVACIASLAQNGICPPPAHSFASALFHTNAFKVFSTTLVSLAVVFLSLALLFSGFIKAILQKALLGALIFALQFDGILSRYLAMRRLRLALVRLEHSPTSH